MLVNSQSIDFINDKYNQLKNTDTALSLHPLVLHTPNLTLIPVSSLLSHLHIKPSTQSAIVDAIHLLLKTYPTSVFAESQKSKITQFTQWDHETIIALLSQWTNEFDQSGLGVWLIYQKQKTSFLDSAHTYPPRQDPILLKDQTIIGLGSLSLIESDQALLDILISKNHASKGYGTEASKALMKFNFCKLDVPTELKKLFPAVQDTNQDCIKAKINRISALVDQQEATASWERLLEKLGMNSTGTYATENHQYQIYSMTKEEFMDRWVVMDE
ncbi:hypothetical protein BC833DRAFT_359863 [Globomyces pollinis-pini]|nr:hypothetical protein BC833DRAFT_359863 [Globomyces pollinis-pini]KAJ2999850.1 hypothetical protein HDV02_001628 [Globomyces sp. JEL0801]